MKKFKGRIKIWDVVNEPRPNSPIEQIDPDFILHAFQWAHEEDPEALLTFNETTLLGNDDRINTFAGLIEEALNKGAPIDIIGVQGHLRGRWLTVDKVYEGLDRFAQFGLPIHITEFDVPMGYEIKNSVGVSFGEMNE